MTKYLYIHSFRKVQEWQYVTSHNVYYVKSGISGLDWEGLDLLYLEWDDPGFSKQVCL